MPVWDRLVRYLHWTLVASVLVAWVTIEVEGLIQPTVHEWAGYLALTVIVVRLWWGWRGPRYARFAQFVRSPGATLAYLRQVAAHREPRHVGHNPLGGWMIVALLLCVVLTGASGWLYTTDRFWGLVWVENLHDFFAHLLLALAAVHVAGVLFSSFRHRENLAGAMLSGRKRAPQPDDVV